MNYQFTTEVDCREINIGKHLGVKAQLDTYKSKAIVEWEAEPELRTYGIKSFYRTVKSVRANIEWNVFKEELQEGDREKLEQWITKETDDYLDGEVEIEINAFENEFEVIEEFEFTKSGVLSPDDCEIDFGKKTITIS